MKNKTTTKSKKPLSAFKHCFAVFAAFMMLWSVSAFAQANGRAITRAQFAKMSVTEQNAFFENSKNRITDLVNATPQQLQVRMQGLIYLTPDAFNGASAEKKAYMINNPKTYVVVANAEAAPKSIITQSEFDNLSKEKQQAIIDSKQFNIIK